MRIAERGARIRKFPRPRTGAIAPESSTGRRAPTTMSAVPSSTGDSKSGAASAGYVPSPSVRMTASRSPSSRKIAWTAKPFPWSRRTGITADAQGSRARSPVPSLELLSKTTISASGSAASHCRRTVSMAAASLKQGMATATRARVGTSGSGVTGEGFSGRLRMSRGLGSRTLCGLPVVSDLLGREHHTRLVGRDATSDLYFPRDLSRRSTAGPENVSGLGRDEGCDQIGPGSARQSDEQVTGASREMDGQRRSQGLRPSRGFGCDSSIAWPLIQAWTSTPAGASRMSWASCTAGEASGV